jgi:hypothetical protein
MLVNLRVGAGMGYRELLTSREVIVVEFWVVISTRVIRGASPYFG